MGWTNFIIIPKLKIAIEISRHVNELMEYEKDTINNIIDPNFEVDTEIGEKDLKKISLHDLTTLYKAYENVINLFDFDSDKFLLYWLDNREIDYKIESEYNVDLNLLNDDGYTIIRM